VLAELRRRGLEVHPQVGVGKYRIDFGVTDPDFPGEYLCGIECDGVAYHSSETARDRDRLRQQILEDRGWTIHRIWSTDWWKDRTGQIDRIVRKVAETREAAIARRRDVKAAETVPQPIVEEPQEPHGPLPEPNAPLPEPNAPLPEPEDEYRRPAASLYTTTSSPRRGDLDILEAGADAIRAAVIEVLQVEAPLHEDDLVTRVAGFWGKRGGSRIRGHILNAVPPLLRAGSVSQVGNFLYLPGREIVARSREEFGIPAERIAPEEYQAGALLVLGKGATLSRDTLTTEIRSVLGFARTGPKLEQEIIKAIDALLANGRLVHAAVGVKCADSQGAGHPV
jgi:very-short-patch-repair endonuclease